MLDSFIEKVKERHCDLYAVNLTKEAYSEILLFIFNDCNKFEKRGKIITDGVILHFIKLYTHIPVQKPVKDKIIISL